MEKAWCMSDWVEYCNLEMEGQYAKWRIRNGSPSPHAVRYWSIGNENYDPFEMGAKEQKEWGRLVLESAKMMKSVDPTVQLSAAAEAAIAYTKNIEVLIRKVRNLLGALELDHRIKIAFDDRRLRSNYNVVSVQFKFPLVPVRSSQRFHGADCSMESRPSS